MHLSDPDKAQLCHNWYCTGHPSMQTQSKTVFPGKAIAVVLVPNRRPDEEDGSTYDYYTEISHLFNLKLTCRREKQDCGFDTSQDPGVHKFGSADKKVVLEAVESWRIRS